MKQYLNWAIVNFSILAMLVLGHVTKYTTLSTLAIIILWITSILAILIYLVMRNTEIAEKFNSSFKSKINKWVDLVYDIVITGILIYFNYPVLAIFYLLHIIILFNLRKGIKNEDTL